MLDEIERTKIAINNSKSPYLKRDRKIYLQRLYKELADYEKFMFNKRLKK